MPNYQFRIAPIFRGETLLHLELVCDFFQWQKDRIEASSVTALQYPYG